MMKEVQREEARKAAQQSSEPGRLIGGAVR